MGVLLGIFLLANIAGSWSFPVDKYTDRASYKGFGQLITAEFYQNTGNLYPNKFLGYHAGKDIEILPGEENTEVPVYAIGDGTIVFAGQVGGYGGVILEKLTETDNTVLYGHIKLTSLKVKAGETVKAGQELGNLGRGFSSETGGERKHLHLGVYKGGDKYFRGYESTKNALNNKWINPEIFLTPITPTPSPNPILSPMDRLVQLVGQIWYNLTHANK